MCRRAAPSCPPTAMSCALSGSSRQSRRQMTTASLRTPFSLTQHKTYATALLAMAAVTAAAGEAAPAGEPAAEAAADHHAGATPIGTIIAPVIGIPAAAIIGVVEAAIGIAA